MQCWRYIPVPQGVALVRDVCVQFDCATIDDNAKGAAGNTPWRGY